jgi:hypothetical protein
MGWALTAVGRITAAVTIAAMFSMSTMSAVHEKMHQWAGEEEQPRQEGKDMSAMLRDQKVPADRQEADKNDVGARGKETRLPAVMIAMIHFRLLHSY